MTAADAKGISARERKWIVIAWVTLCLIWSSTWLVIKIGLRDLPPISFCGIRFVIAAAVLLVICIGRYPLPRRLADYGFLAFTGVINFGVNYGLLFWGEQHVSSGLAAILQATIPTFGLLFAHFMLPSEPMRWERITGGLLALVGVALICIKLLDFHGLLAFWGGVAIVTGAIAVAYVNVLIKARPVKYPAAVMASLQMVFALVPLLLLGYWLEGNPLQFHWTRLAVACLLYLALVGSVLAFLLFYWLLNRVPVTNLLTISLITPPLAVGIGWFFAGETLSPWALLGGLFVLLGVGLILWKSALPVTVATLSAEAKS